MSHSQIATLAVLAGMAGLFLWDRLRYDVVALLALLAAVAVGIVPAKHAFSGFASPILPLIAGALVVSAAIARSGAVEILFRWLQPAMRVRVLQVGILSGCVTALSAFMKNVATLALFLPLGFQVARRHERSPSEFLMPMGFASLLGGSITLIGTSPNMLISEVRTHLTGQPFHMFDFTPVGVGTALCGILFLNFGWRLIPRGRRAASEAPFKIEDYTTEFQLGADSPFIGRTVAEVEEDAGGEVSVIAIIREQFRRHVPAGHWQLLPQDVLVVEADPQALDQFTADGRLSVVGSKELPEPPAAGEEPAKPRAGEGTGDGLVTVEAIVAAGSPLIGRSLAELNLRQRYGVNVLAIGQRGRRTTVRLRRVKFQLGDVIVFQGYSEAIHDTLAALGTLPLAERRLNLGRRRQLLLPLAILALAVAVSAFRVVPVDFAFLGAGIAVILSRLLTLEEAYEAIEWPILILIGALIPIGEAVRNTGTTHFLAGLLSHLAAHLSAGGAVALILAVTMLVTPILHHAAAVLVMGPVAASLAHHLGYHIDPFLMAVAFGAGSDFLSPIGHPSNTLVMGPGGYHFGDYWKLGLPLSMIVIGVGVPLILLFWPVQ
ncbi:MAG TPA: SLC13 family permease [Stellaceae bacterium]|nr:SLC13 family permease [Stellaceae bacterium]